MGKENELTDIVEKYKPKRCTDIGTVYETTQSIKPMWLMPQDQLIKNKISIFPYFTSQDACDEGFSKHNIT